MAAGGELCHVVATVPTGLEKGAADECREVLGRGNVIAGRGKISFPLQSLEEISKVDKLRAIENYSVLVKDLPDFCRDESTALERLVQLPADPTIDWTTPLSVWRHYHHMKSTNSSSTLTSENTESDSGTDAEVAPTATSTGSQLTGDHWSFRVTCVRGGRKHSFSSMEAAGRLGAGLAKQFGWKVQMKNSDIEVLLNISGDAIRVLVALSRESMSLRNIAHFGPTTLRSAIAYGLLRHADIQPGEVVLDPMCGGASISIEGSLAWPSTYHVSGDMHELATPRAMANVRDLRAGGAERGLKVDVIQWDVRALPLRTASVDVVVTDLPFGKKSGRKVDNWELYPSTLQEIGRVCRPSIARAILLTHDNKALSRALLQTDLWKRHLTKWINIGGLTAALYILHRTGTLHSQ